jgi:protein TonB
MREFAAVIALCMAAVVLRPLEAAAADTWVEVKSNNFTVMSDGGESTARKIAWQFEQVHAAIDRLWPSAKGTLNRPLVIIAAKNEASFVALTPLYSGPDVPMRLGSLRVAGPDRFYILVRADVGPGGDGLNPYRAAYASYASLQLDSRFARALPLWLTEGLSAVMSNAIVHDDRLEFGRPIRPYIEQFMKQPRLSLRDLLAVGESSSYNTQPTTRPRFVAQCWALVHYMLFRGPGQHGEAVDAVTRLVLQQTPSPMALETTFGDLNALENSYVEYVRQGRFQFLKLDVAPRPSAKTYPARRLDDAESAGLRAGFLVAHGRTEAARTLLATTKADARATAFHDAEGLALEAAKQPALAQQAYRTAVDAGSTSFFTHHRLAMLLWRRDAGPDVLNEVERLLRRATALNDRFAPSFAFLASVLVQSNQPEVALPMAMRAAALEPDDVSHRLLVVSTLTRLNRRDEARTAAEAALKLDVTEQQRRALQSLLARPDAGETAGPVASTSAQPTRRVDPVYPPIAQAARVQGLVVLEATVGPDGKVRDARVVQSIPLLDQAAIDAVLQWEFPPRLVDGVPVAATASVAVQFTLK